MMRPLLLLVVLAACGGPAPKPHATEHVVLRDDLDTVYRRAGVQGGFVLHDLSTGTWTLVDSANTRLATLPASTYKVVSSLIALESGVAADTSSTLPWDGVHRRPQIDRDLSLRNALRYSAYWYHRDVARKLGADRLKHWWDTLHYANADTSGGYDRAWLTGGMRITPWEQVAFLERLYRNALPVSERSMRLVKEMLLQQDTLGYVLRGKTGWADLDTMDIGWFVGWVERTSGPGGPWVFANRVMCADTSNAAFGPARRGAALALLRRAGVLPADYPERTIWE